MGVNILEIVTAVIIALGGARIIPKAVEGYRAWKSGKAREEKEQNRSALGRLVDAEHRADDEATFRRRLEEYASQLRRMLIDLGVPEERLPAWPQRRKVNS
jgi:hypothetical protein